MVDASAVRVCRRCGRELPLERFFVDRRKPGGRGYQCKECRLDSDWRKPASSVPPPVVVSDPTWRRSGSRRPVLLDAFACAGVGADGYAAAGWEVVGLDNDSSALKHNPHEHVAGDAMVLLADAGFMAEFDAVHASPPCQGHSATRSLALAQGAGSGRSVDLVEPVAGLLRAWGGVWVMENVERSPLRGWPGAVRFCGSSWGLRVQRHRWFVSSPGVTLSASPCDHSVFEVDPVSGRPRPWGVYGTKGQELPDGGRVCRSLEHASECMGVGRRVPWRCLAEALPPAFTESVGRDLLAFAP